MIVSLGIATFFQQSLKYRPAEDSIDDLNGASMPVAQYIQSRGDFTFAEDDTDASLGLLPSFIQGLSSDAGAQFAAPATCGSSHCEWDSYSTLAVCNSCADLSSQLNIQEMVFPGFWTTDWWVLENNFGLSGAIPGRRDIPNTSKEAQSRNSLFNITTTKFPYSPWEEVAFKENGSKIFSVFAVGNTPGTSPRQPDWTPLVEDGVSVGDGFADPIAYECILQFCIMQMSAKVLNGTLTETQTAKWTNNDLKTIANDVAYTLNPPFDSSVDYVISGDFWTDMANHFSDQLIGNVTYVGSSGRWKGGESDPDASTDDMKMLFKKMNDKKITFPEIMDNIAQSLTHALRTVYGKGQPTVAGTIYIPTNRAKVTWPWLVLPLFELVASLVFLITVMMQTRRRGLHPWTNDPLAYFFHGLDERLVGVSGMEKDMKAKAQSVVVEFERYDQGGRLVVVGAGEAVGK